MIVVAIMGILASLAVGFFRNFVMRSKQAEAQELLASVYTVESAYFAETNAYGDLTAVGFAPSSTPRFYTNIGAGNFTYTATSFSGSCSANLDGDVTQDVWEITQGSRAPQLLTNDITN